MTTFDMIHFFGHGEIANNTPTGILWTAEASTLGLKTGCPSKFRLRRPDGTMYGEEFVAVNIVRNKDGDLDFVEYQQMCGLNKATIFND